MEEEEGREVLIITENAETVSYFLTYFITELRLRILGVGGERQAQCFSNLNCETGIRNQSIILKI